MTAIQKFIVTIIVLAAVGGGAYYLTVRPAATAPGQQATSTPSGTTATTSTSGASNSGGATPTLVTPDYKKPIAFSVDIAPDIRTQLNAELKTVQGQIAENPLNPGPWINLGTLHKQGGDYANAELYWLYVTTAYRGKLVPYYSLGDLYENFLHDYAKAEVNYKAAIKTDPQNVNAYASLYTMYHYTLKDDTKAAAILADGLKANPGNNYLLGLQKELQAK